MATSLNPAVDLIGRVYPASGKSFWAGGSAWWASAVGGIRWARGEEGCTQPPPCGPGNPVVCGTGLLLALLGRGTA